MAVTINVLNAGNMTLGSGGSSYVPHSDTRVTYTASSGLSDWSEEIVGDAFSIPNWFDSETIEFGSTVTMIPSEALYDASHLTTLTIPDSITGIQDSAFSCCTSLINVTIYANGGNANNVK